MIDIATRVLLLRNEKDLYRLLYLGTVPRPLHSTTSPLAV